MGGGGKGGGDTPKMKVTDFYLSDHVGVCHGPADGIPAIYVGEKKLKLVSLWAGPYPMASPYPAPANGHTFIEVEPTFVNSNRDGSLCIAAAAFVSEGDGGLQVSRDNKGTSWEYIGNPISLAGGTSSVLLDGVVSQDGENIIVVGAGGDAGQGRAEIAYSADGGYSWSLAVTNPFKSAEPQALVDEHLGSYGYWIPEVPHISTVCISADKSLAVAAGYGGRIAVSVDQGETWSAFKPTPYDTPQMHSVIGHEIHRLNINIRSSAISADGNRIVLVGYINMGDNAIGWWDGAPIILRSTDRGETWQDLSYPLYLGGTIASELWHNVDWITQWDYSVFFDKDGTERYPFTKGLMWGLQSVAMSDDGMDICVNPDALYTEWYNEWPNMGGVGFSSDGGDTWGKSWWPLDKHGELVLWAAQGSEQPVGMVMPEPVAGNAPGWWYGLSNLSCSADGSVLLASSSGTGYICVSKDFGRTWAVTATNGADLRTTHITRDGSMQLGISGSALAETNGNLGIYVNAGTLFAVNMPKLFGGPKKEGGVAGLIFPLFGGSYQVLPAGIASKLSAGSDGYNVPGYRNICSLFFTGTKGQDLVTDVAGFNLWETVEMWGITSFSQG